MLFQKYVILVCAFVSGGVYGTKQNDTESSSSSSSSTGNSLWDSLFENCKKQPTMQCVQNSVYQYLDTTFEGKDIDVASFLKLTKNNLDYKNDVQDDEFEGRSSPFSEVADALRDKATKFLYTHDVELTLPEFFGSGVLKISPRSLEEGGALVKVDVQPKETPNSSVEPRIFFKKIQKFFSSKLLMALMAILLVIKLLSMKFMFFLPMLMGVAAAKKLLLKVLLFLFPVLSHLFKLCPYYSPTKFHHHHHQISHLHQLPHIPHLHGGIELDHPPPGWHEHNHNEHQDDLGYYSDGVASADLGLGHRKTYELGRPVRHDEENVYGDYGQGQPGLGHHTHETKPPAKQKTGPLTPTEIENMVLKAEKEAMLKARLQEEQKRVEMENKRLQDKIKNALKLQDKLKIHSIVAKQTSNIAAAYQPHIYPAAQIVHTVPHVPPPTSYLPQPYLQSVPTQAVYPSVITQQQQQPQTAPVYHQQQSAGSENSPVYLQNLDENYDEFYSPILAKIDKIFVELGFHEESCRERLVCSMYKNPTKFSPHSNLLSAELSRDASELQKPTTSNSAVIRFYKYVQAARDGQDKRDCLRLYPSCLTVTE